MTRMIRCQVVLAVVISLAGAVCFAQSIGEALYHEGCAGCHGSAGAAETPVAKMLKVKPLSDPYITSLTANQMFHSVKNGKGRMGPFKRTLTDEEIGDVVAFYRELGNMVPAPVRSPQEAAAPAGEPEAQAAPVGPYAAIAGEYVFEQSGGHYIFHPDGSCTVRLPGGLQTPCQFIVDGDWIRLTVKIGDTNLPVGNFKMQGEKLYRNGTIAPNAELIRQGVPPPLPPREPAAPTTPSAGLHKYDDLAAPQPPPAPAPTISMGETKSQVIALRSRPFLPLRIRLVRRENFQSGQLAWLYLQGARTVYRIACQEQWLLRT